MPFIAYDARLNDVTKDMGICELTIRYMNNVTEISAKGKGFQNVTAC